MSNTVSKIGFGIALSHSTTIGGTYTAVAEVLSLTPPPQSVEEVKVYRSDNTAAVVERVPGWTEIGDAEIEVTLIPSQKTTLQGLRGTFAYWKVTYPLMGSQTTTGDTEIFYGFLKEIGTETPLKDVMKTKLKFAVSGDITFATGT